MKNTFSQRYPAIFLGVIMILAFAVRAYNFSDWLYYKWDQGRDSFVIAQAYEKGPGYLPLLGPRATKVNSEGDYLRLGPAYFYFQYASAILSDSIQPEVFAYPDLFFSIAIIPLLYLFLRLFFSKPISLILVVLYSFSFIIIQYSRFSWNPNSVPFFTLLTCYSLVKITSVPADSRSKKWWVAIWAFALAIASQLHFFACFSLMGISAIYLFLVNRWWNLKEIFSRSFVRTSIQNWRLIAIVIGIFFLIYSPFIVSEIKLKGENSANFVRAFTYKPEDRPLVHKIKKNIKEQANHFYLIVTSYNYDNQDVYRNRISMGFGAVLILSGLILTVRELLKAKEKPKRHFLIMLIVWLGVFGLVCIPMAFQLRPRFFVVVFAMPFIFIGLWFKLLQEKLGPKAWIVVFVIAISVLALNLNGTYAWFREQQLSQIQSFETNRTMILKRKDGVTLGQMRRAVDYMYQRSEGKPVAFYAKSEYNTSYPYLFYLKDSSPQIERIHAKKPDGLATMYIIANPRSGLKNVDKRLVYQVDVIEQQQFGQIIVYLVTLKSAPQTTGGEDNEGAKEADEAGEEVFEEDDDDRLYWKDVL